MKPRIAIVGGGMAGVSAAHYLQQAGLKNFVLFEASDRIGGRIHTKYFKESNGVKYKIELGAEWIHGTENSPANAVAIDHNLFESLSSEHQFIAALSPWVNSSGNVKVAKLSTKYQIAPSVHEEVEELMKTAISHCRKLASERATENHSDLVTVGSILDEYFSRKLNDLSTDDEQLWKSLLEQELNALNFYEACDSMHDVTLEGYHFYEDLDGDEPKVAQGSVTLVEAMAKTVPSSRLLLSTPVTNIAYDIHGEGGVTVTTAAGQEHFDCVIVTCSIGVLQACCNTLFEPQLSSDKLVALQHLRLGAVNKVYLEFDSLTFIPSDVDRLELFWCDDDRLQLLEWTWKIAVVDVVLEKPTRNMIAIWLAGRGAEMIEKLSDDEVMLGLTQVLRHFLKNPSIPLPTSVLRTAWLSNPYTRGSYSYNGHGTKLHDRQVLSEPLLHSVSKKPVVLFAGEATHSMYYSTMHGALMTGKREAERLAQCWP